MVLFSTHPSHITNRVTCAVIPYRLLAGMLPTQTSRLHRVVAASALPRASIRCPASTQTANGPLYEYRPGPFFRMSPAVVW